MKKHLHFNSILAWIYQALSLTILWYLGLALGLGICGLIPTSISSFYLMNQLKSPRFRDRMRIWPAWKQVFLKTLKAYWWISVPWLLVLWILMTNLVITGKQSGLVASVVHYWTLFLIFLWTWILITFTYAAASHPDLGMTSLVKNALLIPTGHLIEMIILTAFTAAIPLIMVQARTGFFVFLGPYLLLKLWHFGLDHLLQGKTIRTFWSNWSRLE